MFGHRRPRGRYVVNKITPIWQYNRIIKFCWKKKDGKSKILMTQPFMKNNNIVEKFNLNFTPYHLLLQSVF